MKSRNKLSIYRPIKKIIKKRKLNLIIKDYLIKAMIMKLKVITAGMVKTAKTGSLIMLDNLKCKSSYNPANPQLSRLLQTFSILTLTLIPALLSIIHSSKLSNRSTKLSYKLTK